jgi:hypothetical protein
MTKNSHPKDNQLFSFKRIKGSEERSFSELNAVEVLEGRGLIEAEQAISELKAWPTSKIEQLCADLFDFLDQRLSRSDRESAGMSPFNCLAGSSIRGDSGCSDLGCRAVKLDSLARYSAIYSDRTFLPVPLESPEYSDNKEALRQGLVQTVTSVLELRPLIEKGIMRPVVPVMHYCDRHAQLAMGTYREGEQAIASLAAKNSNKFRFTYELLNEDPPIGALELRGPFRLHRARLDVSPVLKTAGVGSAVDWARKEIQSATSGADTF